MSWLFNRKSFEPDKNLKIAFSVDRKYRQNIVISNSIKPVSEEALLST